MLTWITDTVWWVLGYQKGLTKEQEANMLLPPLFLDAASALDFETQRKIYEYRKKLQNDRSTIFELCRAF
tara:strand:- start:844 stop:1053 length:210 start_codon:yes stop_codon:yes gene_type:complete